ncbi:prolyl endopeptidase-like [Notolabrus celidotus]|uniref:prolyl endopeptidase-like n=1 Tax=Notolabrus celidotus TaxID=1203425 RepID=UPI00148F4A55|nr:prolyl endopeptidase-like [Notolabrus celidotus]
MAIISLLLISSARLISPSRVRHWEFAIYRRMTRIVVPSQRCFTSDTFNSSVNQLSPGLERYKDFQKYFNRRLNAIYHRFSDLPDHSVIYGRHHVYFVEGEGIYRMDIRTSEPEQVLNLGQVSEQEQKMRLYNEESKERYQWIIQRIRVSPQEKNLAATFKADQREELRCVVVALGESNSPAPDPPHVVFTTDKVFTFEWASDEVLFYTTLVGLRCSKVFRLDLTSNRSRITSVYEETHPDVFVEVALSRDREILSINCNSRTSSEVRLIDTATPHLEPVLVQPRQQDLLYHVEHWRRQLIILANTGHGQEYQVVQAPLSEPSMASWVPLFAPGSGTVLKDMDVVGDHCVLVARTPAKEFILIVVPLNHPKEGYTVQLPSWACAITTKNPSMADQRAVFQFLISSPVCPPVPYSLNPEDSLLLCATKDRSPPQNQNNYTTTRLEACSQDGTPVPVTLLHSGHVQGLKQAPLLVHVYGAYGRDLNMEFCPEKHLLLEQGWALAYCHIRGGGEQGLSCHRKARVEGKQRSVEDLEACLHHLFSVGVSCPSLTALTACSAGAVAVGALCNRHPYMMRAVTLQAPFLDVLGSMEDPSLPLTFEDIEEWGDPIRNLNHRLIISSYCPLCNITPQCYPSILLTAYRDDARVPLAGVLKYTEQVRSAIQTHCTVKPKSGCEPAPNIVLNIQPGANHHGPEDFSLMLEEEALKLAFLYTELGLELPRFPRKRKR